MDALKLLVPGQTARFAFSGQLLVALQCNQENKEGSFNFAISCN